MTVNVADRVTLLYVAVIVAEEDAATAAVVAVKVALVAPAATVTLAGTAATAVLLLESAMTAPPAGAAPDSVTVPVEFAPPVRLGGLRVTAFSVAGPLDVRCGRTATQSRKKSRDVEPATLITRRRKFAFVRSAADHVRPQVSDVPPSVNVLRFVPSVLVAFAAVHVAPPFHESCTHIRGDRDVLSARASSRTSMPATADPVATERPKS